MIPRAFINAWRAHAPWGSKGLSLRSKGLSLGLSEKAVHAVCGSPVGRRWAQSRQRHQPSDGFACVQSVVCFPQPLQVNGASRLHCASARAFSATVMGLTFALAGVCEATRLR
jgi:hypothetical protein